MRQSMPPIRNWDKPFSMFYDETNNIRRLTLSEVGLNAPENRSFVLAGIVLQPGQHIENIDALRAMLQVQANAMEIKFKHVAQGDYEAALASRCLNSFLTWLLDQGVLIHYSQLSILYWSLIDIIESLMLDNTFGINEYHMHLKSELYDIVTRSPAEFMSLLHSFAYPNVDRGRIKAFLGAVSDFLDRHSPENRNDGTMLLKQTLRQAVRMDELVFLHDNEPGELIQDFGMHFLRSVYVFKNASHTFDRETYVEKVLQSFDVLDGQRRVDYRFVDSKANTTYACSCLTLWPGLWASISNTSRTIRLRRLRSARLASPNCRSKTSQSSESSSTALMR
ncbi:MAG: Uncharacterized protein AWT59_2258 [Candidatus Gallionella acididurans]|uniref:DUF3800 domain-containing protein n=1 Tax=Candidatus Gallionella acididurans TaxID=1796491 RepID=A0A139BRJ0_9PROT|nr:MAG: Uncharacterized protein AWT59_2258 [Candidatus Gallionella acididurans]